MVNLISKDNDDLSADIEFDKLASLYKFEGHSRASLLKLYDGMLFRTMKRLGKKSKREVTVEEVEEWWKNSTRPAKKGNLIEKEQQMVEAYYRIKQEFGHGRS